MIAARRLETDRDHTVERPTQLVDDIAVLYNLKEIASHNTDCFWQRQTLPSHWYGQRSAIRCEAEEAG